ncbi:U4 U6 small nuclear ribonucleo Prp31-like [Micractinium conductrix]|uniref:U4 U6 small nuclear ribonucleo Prp31-like n=1 Tax=Micractinium conductrix TaxID=554055 RepID=A0A2P6VIC6_9CHLO|nr:U4 U6 small nuclear ribonucleo Prp31-like [Micractinium conductrix]|eukprot:PSC73830.1 U4 U6 small nuclear ribonucleo Prp31-like [Micractinium conductrix]
MATLAESFLADLEDLSDDDAEEPQQQEAEGEGDEEMLGGDELDNLNYDNLEAVAQLTRSERYQTIMAAVRDAAAAAQKGEAQPSTWAGPSEEDPTYKLLVDCNQLAVDIDNEIVVVYNFLRDRYKPKFPELESLVHNPLDYARVVQMIGNEMDVTLVDLDRLLPPATVMVVTVTATTTSGKPLSEEELKKVVDACEMTLQLEEDKHLILRLVQQQMDRIAPNLSAAVGTEIAAQLMGVAGGLVNLSKMPACNVQVLGAKRRNLAGFSSTTAQPHQGFIFGSDIMQQTPPSLRSKAARLVGAKCTLLARVDAYGQDPSGTAGRSMKDDMLKKIEKWQEPPPAKTTKVLPAPDAGEGKKRRGGKRYRKMKERFGLTDLRKQANRMMFNQAEDEWMDGEDTVGLGMIGKEGSGRLRAVAAQQRQKLSAKAQKKFALKNYGSSGATSGLSSSLAFTPIQGIELANPNQAAQDDRMRDGTESYFSEYSGFRSSRTGANRSADVRPGSALREGLLGGGAAAGAMHNGNGSEVEYGGQAAAELGESTAVPKRPCPDDDDEECADMAERMREPDLWGSLFVGAIPSVRPQHAWVHVDAAGQATMVEHVDKHRIVADLGVRYRDLLALDPTVPIPFPASILIREQALVVNLEVVRMIICSNQCYVLSAPKPSDPRVTTFATVNNPFVRQLCRCLRTGKSTATLHDLSRDSAGFDFNAPYELRALEVALATAVNVLDREVFELEREAYPSVDRLAVDVSKGVLEDVRRVKSTLNKLQARVQRVKRELEEILDDDADMQDMYLARRAMMLGEEPPPDRVEVQQHGMGGRSQSVQSLADSPNGSYQNLGRRADSEADAARGGGTAEGPSRRHDPPSESGASNAAAPQGGLRHRHGASRSHGTTEHLGHHSRSAHDVAGGGGRHGGGHHGSKGWKRAGTLVRTVRRKGKKGRGHSSPPPSPVAEQRGGGGEQSGGQGGDVGEGWAEAAEEAGEDMDRTRSAPSAIAVERGGDDDDEDDEYIEETFIEGPSMPGVDPHEIEDCEDLLETYYLQVDYLLRRLLSMNERIDDTEDLVAIKMDHRRNELVATDLMVSVGTAGFAWVAMIAGLFGMNLVSGLESAQGAFWGVVGASLLGGLAIIAGLIAWIRYRRLMFIPRMAG